MELRPMPPLVALDESTFDDVFAEIRSWQRRLDKLPPVPHRIVVDHRVPHGEVYRMWNTRGKMIAYANPGEIADLPHRTIAPGDPTSLFGIPIVRA